MARPRITDQEVTEEKLGKNPFIDSLRVYAFEMKTSEKYYKEVKPITDVSKTLTSDEKTPLERYTYTKFFDAAENDEAIDNLDSKSSQLLLWVMRKIKPGKDYVVVNSERFIKRNNTSHSTYRRSVLDLVNAGILGNTMITNVFFINPKFFFKGSRIKKYPDNVIMIGTADKKPIKPTDELK